MLGEIFWFVGEYAGVADLEVPRDTVPTKFRYYEWKLLKRGHTKSQPQRWGQNINSCYEANKIMKIEEIPYATVPQRFGQRLIGFQQNLSKAAIYGTLFS